MSESLLVLFFKIELLLCLPLIANAAAAPDSPEAHGFVHFYKCPSGRDVERLGDTGTSAACLSACQAHGPAAGCWWLDGTGGFPRQCRVCRVLSPVKRQWPNDWALPLAAFIS
jgi:hypothetical protein